MLVADRSTPCTEKMPPLPKPKRERAFPGRVSAGILSADPAILYTAISPGLPLGVGSIFADRFGKFPATFLISPAWTIEQPDTIRKLHAAAEAARKRCADHEFFFLCNTERECELLTRVGENALLVNHNVMLSENFYHPIPGAEIEFDAIYNARFASWKRHELAANIPRVSYLAYHIILDKKDTDDAMRERIDTAVARPGHRLLNNRVDGLPVWLPPREVNAAYNHAAVGLCLSPVEGAMQASFEYLLAGLPIVSTPSKGGRDVFFDPSYCLIVDPDAHAVAEAVATLRDRKIPREHIRAESLAKCAPQRQRLLSLLNEILERKGFPPRFDKTWPFNKSPKMRTWRTLENIEAELRKPAPALGAVS